MNFLARLSLPLAIVVLLGLVGQGCSPAQSGPVPTRSSGPVYVIGLSPFLEDSCKDDLYRRIAQLLLEEMPLGSSLRIYDAYHLRLVANIEIPSLGAFRSSKTRANQFKNEFYALQQFLAAHPAPPEATNLELTAAVRFPQFLKFIGEQRVGPGARPPARILILGSPLYLDPKEPSFSMARGYYPSDGHLAASEEQSIFGLKSRSETLRDVRVCFGYFGDPWVSELHQERVARFWRLFVQGQGGLLANFCGDPATVFAAFAADPSSVAAGVHEQPDPAATKIEMLRATRRVEVTDWITNESPAHLRTDPPAHEIGPLKIGIRWQGNIDLDLYSRPRPGAATLSFQHTTSPEGYYFKDHRSSPLREYEFIEFETAVNVRDLEASINFYKGAASGGPSGEVRVEFDGGVYVGQFHLRAETGNQARSGPGQETYWVRLDLPRLLRLVE